MFGGTGPDAGQDSAIAGVLTMAAADGPRSVIGIDSRRKLRALNSLHVLTVAPQKTLDDICEIMVRSMRGDIAVIVLSDERDFHVIGSCGTSVKNYASDLLTEDWPADGIIELHDVDKSDWGPQHPLVNGEVDRMVSTCYTALHYDGQIVGLAGVGSRIGLDSYTETERNILLRLTRITEALIRAETTLSRLAAEAFRTLERIRREAQP